MIMFEHVEMFYNVSQNSQKNKKKKTNAEISDFGVNISIYCVYTIINISIITLIQLITLTCVQ